MKDFEKFYTEFLSYKALYGTSRIPVKYYAAGYPLGQRASALRNGGAHVNKEQKKLLDEADFLWNVKKNHSFCPFDRFLAELKKYQTQFGTLNVPRRYVTSDGILLGMLVKSFKYGSRKMTPRQREKLLDIGFSFEKKFYNSYSFSDVYKALQTFYDTHVSHQVPHSYVDETGCPIGKISYEIRYHKRKISPKQWKALNDIGFMWTSEREELPFEEKLHLLEAYKAEYGHVNVPQKYVTDDGDPLGEIVHLIRQQTALPKEEVDALNGLGFVWKNNERRTYPFYMVLSMFQEYFQQHGNFDIPITYKTKEGYPLGSINYGIRTGHRKTSKEQKEALEQIGYRF